MLGYDEPEPEPVPWRETPVPFEGWFGFFWGLCGWAFLYTSEQMASMED